MKHFTVDEANEALQLVRPLAEELVAVFQRAQRVEQRAAPLRAAVAGNGSVAMRERLRDLDRVTADARSRMGVLIETIEELGAQVKDLELGLVDFPAEREGETVLLCWRVGEDEIAYWHGLEEGFAGRRPLPL
jgi:hypothetical protein